LTEKEIRANYIKLTLIRGKLGLQERNYIRTN